MAARTLATGIVRGLLLQQKAVAKSLAGSLQDGGSLMGTIRFAGDLSPLVAFSLMGLAVVLVVWFYLRETRAISSPYNYLIPGLRAAAVALTILILAGPVMHRRVTIGTLGRVIFAIDNSQSMSLEDDTARK